MIAAIIVMKLLHVQVIDTKMACHLLLLFYSKTILEIIYYFFTKMVDTIEQCCNELILNWNVDKIPKYKKLMASPVGIYEKQTLLNEFRIVYYNNATDYYIFHNGNEWVVSSCYIRKSRIYFS